MQPRDVDLAEWLDGIGFKPANTEEKQLGHEAARQMVATFGAYLHAILPPGRDKSIAFTELEYVLMRANRALALGGPKDSIDAESLRALVAHLRGLAIDGRGDPLLTEDPRIEEYKASQRGESPEMERANLADVEPQESADFLTQTPEEVLDAIDPSDPETYRYVVRGLGGDGDIHLEVSGEYRRAGLGYVQFATTCNDPVKLERALGVPVQQLEAKEGEPTRGTFHGWWFTVNSPERLNLVLRALAAAGKNAWR